MQKKKGSFLEKIVKKDYNNELEEVLESKNFDENAKNLLLSILYKIKASYKDYEKVKVQVDSKEEYIKKFIGMIKNNCENIKIVKINSDESDILGDKTFLIEKNSKRIICYPIERKLLYCIAKISKNDSIIKEKYEIIDQTLSNLINIGASIDTVEPLRDFNGYSWTTINKEIESVVHNLIYQNLRILLGNKFIERWIRNKEFIIDYMEILKNTLGRKYGTENQNNMLEELKKISMLLELKYNKKAKEKYANEKKIIEEKLENFKDKKKCIEMITQEKKALENEIKRIDETMNDKELLQNEYVKRNEKLPLEKKIFSARILSKIMREEREQKIEELSNLNELINPKKFIAYKKSLEEKYKYLKLVDTKDLEKSIEQLEIKLQKLFLECYKLDIEKIENKVGIIKKIYEYRYYNLLPFDYDKKINEVTELKENMKEVRETLIKKAQDLKVMPVVSKNQELDDEILRHIFDIREISLEEIYIKLTKDKDKFYVQLFDEGVFEEKVELKDFKNINKKDLEIKINKKVKVFI